MRWFSRVRNRFTSPVATSTAQSEGLGCLSIEPEMAECGHATLGEGEISFYGETTFMKMPRNVAGGFDFCLDCIASMSIRCAWCQSTIFIGSPVTLYTPKPDFPVPSHAVVYSDDPLQLVGCLGWECAFTGGDRAGFWITDAETGKGRVRREMSPIEMALREARSIMVNDLGDPSEKPTVL